MHMKQKWEGDVETIGSANIIGWNYFCKIEKRKKSGNSQIAFDYSQSQAPQAAVADFCFWLQVGKTLKGLISHAEMLKTLLNAQTFPSMQTMQGSVTLLNASRCYNTTNYSYKSAHDSWEFLYFLLQMQLWLKKRCMMYIWTYN